MHVKSMRFTLYPFRIANLYRFSTMNTANYDIASVTSQIREIYSLQPQPLFSLQVTGGGIDALRLLLSVPGASTCVMEAGVPYARSSLRSYLRGSKAVYNGSISCSTSTAIKLSKAAYVSTIKLFLAEDVNHLEKASKIANYFGVSCTAALLSNVPKKGKHRCHIGVYSGQSSITYSVELTAGLRDRIGEDQYCSKLILDAISLQCGLNPSKESIISPQECRVNDHNEVTINYHHKERCCNDILEYIYDGKLTHALLFKTAATNTFHSTSSNGDSIKFSSSGSTNNFVSNELFTCFEEAFLPEGTLVYSGSFNPLHEGHLALVQAELQRRLLEKQQKQEEDVKRHCSSGEDISNIDLSTEDARNHSSSPPLVVFEIAAMNADKPPLPREELWKRLKQFDINTNPLFRRYGITNFAVCVTSEPLFVGKAKLFPGCVFLIGSDTFARLIDSKYYTNTSSSIATTTDNRVSIDAYNDGTVANSFTSSSDNTITNNPTECQQQQQHLMNMIIALTRIAESGCRFTVGGRIMGNSDGSCSAFTTYNDVLRRRNNSTVDHKLPVSLLDQLFIGLSESQFRLDISSTEIRQQQQADNESNSK